MDEAEAGKEAARHYRAFLMEDSYANLPVIMASELEDSGRPDFASSVRQSGSQHRVEAIKHQALAAALMEEP